MGVLNSLVAAVPFPAVPGTAGQEVSCALVLHPLREAQQHPHVVVCGFGGVGSAGESGSCRQFLSLFLSPSPSPPFPFSLPSPPLSSIVLYTPCSIFHPSPFLPFIHPFLSSFFLHPQSSSFILHLPLSPFILHSVLHLPPSSPTLPSSFILHPSSSSSILLHLPSFTLHLTLHISSQAPSSFHHYPWQDHQSRILSPSVP